MNIYNAIDILANADIYSETHAIVEDTAGIAFRAPLAELYKTIHSIINPIASFEPLDWEDEVCEAFLMVRRESMVNLENSIPVSISRQLMNERFS